MFVAVREKTSDSWLDPRCSGLVGFKVAQRLWRHCIGKRGLFLTLTYDRTPYKDAVDLYRTQSEEQHVALFMRRLSRFLGVSLKGKWFCKMEFQQDGYVHWHIILLDVDFIDAKECARIWSHGFVKIKKITKKRVFYTCKYLTKDGKPMPSFLLLERPRSVKVVRVSPGFWKDTKPAKPKEYDPYDDYGPDWGNQKIEGSYVPLGVKLAQRPKTLMLYSTQEGQRKKVIDAHPVEVMTDLLAKGATPVRKHRGWQWYRVNQAIQEALDDVGNVPRAASQRAGGAR
ncbi:MAG: hypothetical protein RID07_01405, partial [Lacipirellulaceae bacterium]